MISRWAALCALLAQCATIQPAAADPTPVEVYGQLYVDGNTIKSKKTGTPARLRGMSMFWSEWMGQYWNSDCIHWLVKDWKVTLIRAAMGVEADKDGYLSNQDAEKGKLTAVVDACIDAGIYVVIDWHDYNAHEHTDDAKAFFKEMSQRYGDKPNVLFETYNEPQEVGWSDTIKPYHEQIVPVIRENSDNIIILGTRTWSQEVDEASLDPVQGENLAYTVHFYAASMGQALRDKVATALNNGAAIFATEWGTCEYTGDGALNLDEAQAWLDFFEQNHISDANWAVSDKAESCSALNEGAGGSGGWDEGSLTQSGAWVRNSLRDYPQPSAGSGGGSSSESSGSGSSSSSGSGGSSSGSSEGNDCPGSFHFRGYGKTQIVPTGWAEENPPPEFDVKDDTFTINMGARAYFADKCTAGKYDNNQYLALNLLGKTMRYMTDMSDSGCGCNAAMYLVSMQQNSEVSSCSDYYCDANKVCGVACAEIDIQEGNMYAWHSTLHTASDSNGVGVGYGGGDSWNGPRDFGSQQYGPNAECIDTTKPFQVDVSFPVDGQGSLTAMEVVMSQEGKSCPIKVRISDYEGMGELSGALSAGMTPVVSYWSDDNMLWMDGKGSDGQGPCGTDNAAACAPSIKFYDFSVFKIGEDGPSEDSNPGGGDSDDEDKFDCSSGLDSWRTGWSDAKKHWCCKHMEEGCPESDDEEHDCDQGAQNWKTGWSFEKKNWCCKHEKKGCEEADSSGGSSPSNSVVGQFGRLRVHGSQVVDKDGNPVQLMGMSFFWSQWMDKYWNKDVVAFLAKDWKCSIVRAAMGVENGGYLKNPEEQKAKVEEVVQAAIDVGIYVIIDWHEENANKHVAESKLFFEEMAKKYGEQPNVIFETFNEPTKQEWSDAIKPYHEQIIPVIRKHSKNLIILGTKMWSQDVDEAAGDPVNGENLAYTVHFYAPVHKGWLREKVTAAMDSGIAVFATEWGSSKCETTFDDYDFDESQKWLDFLEENHISSCNWAVSDKGESCSALKQGTSTKGGWKDDDLTESGIFVRKAIRKAGKSLPTGSSSSSGSSSGDSDSSGGSSSGVSSEDEKFCPGAVGIAGYGKVSLVNAKLNVPGEPAGKVKVESGKVVPLMTGRTYFAKKCSADNYNNEDYVALNLLGKTLRYTTDMSGAGCGCNAALYLVSMAQNDKVSQCEDYYCDANNVCGESCAEIDLQEANQHAWHSTLHTASDSSGSGGGYGGGSTWDGPRDWGSREYGPNADCIDTSQPFQVSVSFPVDGQGNLQSMDLELSQDGKSCPIKLSLGSYDGMGELSGALSAGMTPVLSYWSSNDMLWMDGQGSDGQGPCGADDASSCGASVSFYDFSIAKIGDPIPEQEDFEDESPSDDDDSGSSGDSDSSGESGSSSSNIGSTEEEDAHCPGTVGIAGHGHVALVNAKLNVPGEPAGKVVVEDGKVVPKMTGRTYFAEKCSPGSYNNEEYLPFKLLGKTFRYTTDMSGAGCGCNAALYLVSMAQNDKVSKCEDYYCDANNVCGESCAEIDIQEANQHAWHSTLHTATDHSGAGGGYGGGDSWNGPRDWGSKEYGPNADCIDTTKPFQVAVSFPVDGNGNLQGMEVELSQKGSSCPIKLSLTAYDGMGELSDALDAGMTPVLSYWSANDMLWMDGKGTDGQGPCGSDDASACTASVSFYDFSVADIGDPIPDPLDEELPSDGGSDNEEEQPTTTTAETTVADSDSAGSSSSVAKAPVGSVVSVFGHLSVDGNKMVNEHGEPVRLRGMSLFWSQWMPQYWNRDVVHWLAEEWHVTIVRAAMGVDKGGYLDHPERETKKLEKVVEACIEAGIYVIVDWHDYEAHKHTKEAVKFFTEMAKKYGSYPNVLFEIYNEPQEVKWSTTIKPYHEEVVAAIRKQCDNIIILGTRSWSKEVLEASKDPVEGNNLAYTFHTYAASDAKTNHGDDLRKTIEEALDNGIAIFATEWGTCEYTGDGDVDLEESMKWLDFFNEHHISDCNWAISDKHESCSALEKGADGKGGWRAKDLTKSGAFMRKTLRTEPGHHSLPPSSATTTKEPDSKEPETPEATCPGAFDLEGYPGKVALVPTGWQQDGAGPSEVQVKASKVLRPHMGARAYFADTCVAGDYDNEQYLALDLLGKTLRYTTDMSGAGCGCNAAMYLVSMRQNTKPGTCHDYYCDANKVCGVACTEIDIQEGNQYSWHSTIHAAADHNGVGGGYGGGDKTWNGPRDFTGREFAPGGECIDTSEPFEVAASFPVDTDGALIGMEVTLTQDGHDCPLKVKVEDYDGMKELAGALREGMTPVISYWSDANMLWMDGKGKDGKGPCESDKAQACTGSVKFYNFAVEELPPAKSPHPGVAPGPGGNNSAPLPPKSSTPPPSTCTEIGESCLDTKCCKGKGMRCYEKDEYWASCKESCTPGIDPQDDPDFQTPWSCKALGPRTPGSRPVKPGLDEDVVIRITAPGMDKDWGVRVKLSDLPPRWEEGREVTLGSGEQQLRGEVVEIKDRSSKGSPALAWTAGIFAALFAMATVVAIAAAAWWRKEAQRSVAALAAAGAVPPRTAANHSPQRQSAGVLLQAARQAGAAASSTLSRLWPGGSPATGSKSQAASPGRSPGPISPSAPRTPGRQKLLSKEN